MDSDLKPAPKPVTPAPKVRDDAIRIFTFPKLIFIFPTLVIAIVCGIGMKATGNQTHDPIKEHIVTKAGADGAQHQSQTPIPETEKHKRFLTPQSLLGVLFLGILSFNLLIMAIDFPRFTVLAILLVVFLALFILLWIGAYFDYDLMKPARGLMGGIYAVANAQFYFLLATVLTVIFVLIWVTRFLDYWEILPNEILHHHGPLSDLERYPTTNLKFDKEIPDVFEYMFLGAGRLVLHVSEERKAIVLDNVLFITHKEEKLKKLMSRLSVRITTDQEVSDQP